MSLIEVIVVMGLLGMVLAFGMVVSLNSITRGTLIGERDLLVSLLISTRTRAMANVDELPQGVHVSATAFTTFEGSSYTAGNPTNRDIPRTTSATTTGPSTIVFDQLSANVTTGAGTVAMGDGTATTTIDLGAYGRIEW